MVFSDLERIHWTCENRCLLSTLAYHFKKQRSFQTGTTMTCFCLNVDLLLRAAHVGIHQDAYSYVREHHPCDDACTLLRSTNVFKQKTKEEKTKKEEKQEDDNPQILHHEKSQSLRQLVQDAFNGRSTKKVGSGGQETSTCSRFRQ